MAATRRSTRQATASAAATAATDTNGTTSTTQKRAHSPDAAVAGDAQADDSDEPPPKKKTRGKAASTAAPKAKAPAKSKAKGKGKKAAAAADEEDGDVDMDGNDNNAAASTSAPAATTTDDKADADDEEDQKKKSPTPPPKPAPKMVKVVKRGAAPVDPEAKNLVNTHQVYTSDGEVWDAMLNQTNVANNNNKFYVIQLLVPVSGGQSFTLHTRWGRVGEGGQSQDKVQSSVTAAISAFKTQFKNKAGTSWENRKDMVPKPGKYVWIERDHGSGDDDKKDDGDEEDEGEASGSGEGKGKGKAKVKEEEKPAEVVAAPAIQSLISFIFNNSFITAHLAEMNYDANKLPLGKLAKSTIIRGFSVLKTLADVINNPTGPAAQEYGNSNNAINELTNSYYSIIPHSFGRNRPRVINNEAYLKQELEVLDALGDMQIASKVLSESTPKNAAGIPIHPIDAHLASLQLTTIEPLTHTSKEFLALEQYAQDTHGATHSAYRVKVEDIFRIEREGERAKWEEGGWGKGDKASADGERLLLWHGSRSTNFAGILKQGLRIAPPEAPVTGYMFGKGVYFADHMSKSANYCYSHLSQGTGLLLLAEVAAAPFNELTTAKYDADVDCKAKNALSTKGVGRVQPGEWQDCAESLEADDMKGVWMPKGKGVDKAIGGHLHYNEYIVYDTSQIRLRYLLRVNMNYQN